ncbi:MAG TPA: CYTH and CHAD domain-containing protein [Jatrophihabitans sp.]|nr:CYTH and CHAD domain-containing protein [Jatrophihabitans sp.]
MAEHHYEREDKFLVAPDWTLPELTPALPAGAVIEPSTVRLSSRYFDTADHALLAQRVTLRARTGDTDTGWQLKLPTGSGRTEVRLPADGAHADAGPAEVPDELRTLVRGLAGGLPLRPVATLDTIRARSRILNGAGVLLAELADDRVTATVPGPNVVVLRWREVEVELGPAGTEKLLAAIGRGLIQAGARPAAGPSKLAQALGGMPGRVQPARFDGRLGGLVWDYLDAQATVLAEGDLALRQGKLPIHSTRVACRRYRSALRVFQDLFEDGRLAALDADLAWYAGLLGEIRDRQVLRKLLAGAVAELPPELVQGPVAERIEHRLSADQGAALERLLAAMSGSRYLAMMAELARWQREPPFTARAADRADKADRYLRQARSTLKRRLRRAGRDGDDHRMHQARKAAKRVRYAAELAEPVLGKPARRQRKRAKKLQQLLGRHQDGVLAAQVLGELARSTDAGDSGFTLGVLYSRMLAGR